MPTVHQIRQAVGGKFFRVVFVKRSDGELRTMRCRMGVTKYVTGCGPRYSFEAKGLLSVYDMDVQGYRTVPVDGIVELKCGRISVVDGKLRIARKPPTVNQIIKRRDILPQIRAY